VLVAIISLLMLMQELHFTKGAGLWTLVRVCSSL